MHQSRQLLIVFACIAVLALRLAGVHLHLCFDGSEAPSALHLADSGLHHFEAAPDHGTADGHHDDVEVPLGDDVVTKLPSLDLPVLAALLMLAFGLHIGGRTAPVRALFAARCRVRPVHLRPPLRGPPAYSLA